MAGVIFVAGLTFVTLSISKRNPSSELLTFLTQTINFCLKACRFGTLGHGVFLKKKSFSLTKSLCGFYLGLEVFFYKVANLIKIFDLRVCGICYNHRSTAQ